MRDKKRNIALCLSIFRFFPGATFLLKRATFIIFDGYFFPSEYLYFENMGSASSSKIGHDFRKQSGSKMEVRKKCFLQKIVS